MRRRDAQLLTAILLIQVAVLAAKPWKETRPAAPKLDSIPSDLGQWKKTADNLLDQDIFNRLTPDAYLARSYSKSTTDTTGIVDLFIAYFNSMYAEFGPHSPRYCLPAAGWLVRSSSILNIESKPAGNFRFPVNFYEMQKDRDRILVYFWYQNNRHVYADEAMAKIYVLPDLFRQHRTDVSLVRVIRASSNGASAGADADAAEDFIRELYPQMLERLKAE